MPSWFQEQQQTDPLLMQRILGQISSEVDALGSPQPFNYAQERAERDANARDILAQREFERAANPQFNPTDIPGMILGAPGRLIRAVTSPLRGQSAGDYWSDRPDLKMQLATGIPMPDTPEQSVGQSALEMLTGARERRAQGMRGLMQAIATRRKLYEVPQLENQMSAARTAAQRLNALQSAASGYSGLQEAESSRYRTNASTGAQQANAAQSYASAGASNAMAAQTRHETSLLPSPDSEAFRAAKAAELREKLFKARKAREEAREQGLKNRALKLWLRANPTGMPPTAGMDPLTQAGRALTNTSRVVNLAQDVAGSLEGADDETKQAFSRLTGIPMRTVETPGTLWGTNKTLEPDLSNYVELAQTPPRVTYPRGGVAGMEGAPPTLPKLDAAAALQGDKASKYESEQAVIDALNHSELTFEEATTILGQKFGKVLQPK